MIARSFSLKEGLLQLPVDFFFCFMLDFEIKF